MRNSQNLAADSPRPGSYSIATKAVKADASPMTLRPMLTDLARAVRFYSRLPVPLLPGEPDAHGPPDFPGMVRVLPLVGAVIGLVPALVLLAALPLGFGPLLSAALAVAALALATGAFHEDGLADTADGFGGGATRERKLVIMKDSRIGSFGGAALSLSLILRVAAVAALADRLEPGAAAAAVIVAAILSRTAALTLLVVLPPARVEGSSYAVGRVTPRAFLTGCVLASALTLALGLPSGLPFSGLLLATVLPIAATLLLARLSARMIGGQTGDVAGAAQQAGEVAALLGLLIAVRP
jgi:adenosylcobinamide-GDP ribazoletransferase